MYKQFWDRYLPIIKVLLKKDGRQSLDLNRLDFESAGISDSNHRFKIVFEKGRVSNIVHRSPVALELAHELSENKQIHDILKEKDVSISLTSKYQLVIDPLEK